MTARAKRQSLGRYQSAQCPATDLIMPSRHVIFRPSGAEDWASRRSVARYTARTDFKALTFLTARGCAALP